MKTVAPALAVALSVALAGSLTATLPARAADLSTLSRLSQSEFRLLSEDLGAALSFKPLIPAEALGITGFDVGVAVTATDLKHAQLLSKASGNQSVPSLLPAPSLRLHKGLPLNIDVGLSYTAAPDTDFSLWGAEARWAFVPGSTLLPAVALRGAFTNSSGVSQLKVQTTSADVSLSKGFAMLTPYAGAGMVWVKSSPAAGPLLREEKFSVTKVYAGLNVNLGINFAVEADSTGGVISYGVKAGLRF
ncbi:MAG: hypothetical protein ACK5TS_04810 [Betaproteobacteria bacterium]